MPKDKAIHRGNVLVAQRNISMNEYPFDKAFTEGKSYLVIDILSKAPCSSEADYVVVIDDSGFENYVSGEFLKNFIVCN